MTGTALSTRTCSGAELREVNVFFYDWMWAAARLVRPERFNTWPLVETLSANALTRLEIAPGLRPRLPITGTHFVDISTPALKSLSEAGGTVVRGPVTALPFPDAAFGLVCALDIVEHIENDRAALAELSRVAAPDAVLLLSVPLYEKCWTAFDDFVGHRRRYEPAQIEALLAAQGFTIEQSAIFGMQPKSSKLLDLGMWCLTHRRRRAMWVYNRIFMPLGVYFQKKLSLSPGFILIQGADEILLVCRKCSAGLA